MAINAMSFLNDANKIGGKIGATSFLSDASLSKLDTAQTKGETIEVTSGQNNGGLWGGIGYLGHKVGLGFLSGIEGIWDYSASGIAKLFGNDEWAEQQMANDWVNYNSADEWFDPSDGWKVAGDVAGGIGTSLPSLAAVGAGAATIYFSGGTLSAPGAKMMLAGISGLTAGLAAAGNATKEAYRETGELTGKEYAYGAMVGATEAALETVSGKIGTGTGRIVKGVADKITRQTAENVAKTVAKKTAGTVIKNLAVDFAQEALEEGVAEIMSPYYKRLTYDPDAENATAQEIGYAALIGGLSGIVMSGANATVNTSVNYLSGGKLVKNNKAASVMETAKQFAESEAAHDTGIAAWQNVRTTYETLQGTMAETGGEIRTARQKMLLGELNKQNALAAIMPEVERSARNMLANPEAAAKAFTEYGMKDANGNAVTVTAEQIREGVDMSDLSSKEGQKRFTRSLRKALTSNSVLSTLAIADATGHLMMDTVRFANAEQSALALASSTDLNRFVEQASEQEKAALGKRLGIEDWSMVTHERFLAAVRENLGRDGGTQLRTFAEQQQRIKAAMAEPLENARPVPHTLRRNMNDGVYRFADDTAQMAVIKEGESYYIVDYDTRHISNPLAVSDVNRVLKQVRDGANARTAAESVTPMQEGAQMRQTAETAESAVNATTNARFALANQGKKRYNKRVPSGNDFATNAMIWAHSAGVAVGERRTLTDGEITVLIEKTTDGYTEIKTVSNYHSGEIANMIKEVETDNGKLYETLYSSIEAYEADGQRHSLRGRIDVGETRNDRSNGVVYQEKSRSNGDNAAPGSGENQRKLKIVTNSSNQNRADFLETKAIDAWAKENVPDYNKLADNARLAVRATIRRARAHGVAEADIKLYASVAAHSGLDIVFDVTTEGDGLYDMRNTIYVDPSAPAERIRAKLLLHEGGHALFWRTKKGKQLMHDAAKMLDADKAKEIEDRYTEHYEEKNVPKERYLPIIEEEIAAAALEDVLGSTDAWEYILAKDPQYESRLLSFFAKAAQDYKHLRDLPADARKLMRQYKTLFRELSARNQGNNATDTRPAVQTQKSVTRMNDENMQVTEDRKALNEKTASRITPDMSEEERAEVLRTQAVSVTEISLPDDLDISIEQLERNMKSVVEKPLIQKMRAMGHLRHYQTSSIEVGFDFTGEGLRKSMNSQVSDYGGNLADLAKVVMNMQPLLDSAVLLEIHADKGKGTSKENARLLNTYVLLSAFAEGDTITPVQFEVKQYVDDNNRLYLAVALTKIKTGVMGDTAHSKEGRTHLLPVSTISIPDLLQKINPHDENFFKYAPNEFLNEAQLAAKRRALDREARKYQKKTENSQTSNDLMERHALPEDGRKAGYTMAELMEGMPYDPEYVLQKGKPRVSGRTSITDGEMQYRIADNFHEKAYSKAAAYEVISKLSGTDLLTQKSRWQLAEALWVGLNRSNDAGKRRAFAHDMAEYTVAKLLAEAKVDNPAAAEASASLAYLRNGVGKLTFTAEDLAEITHARDKKGARSVLGRWGRKNAALRQYPMDQFVNDIAKEMPGMEHLSEMHPADAFLEIDSLYDQLREQAKEKQIPAYWDLPDSEIPAMVKSVEESILRAYSEAGEKSKFARRVEIRTEEMSRRAEYWKAEHDNLKGRDKLLGLLSHQAQKMKDLKLGTFANATQYKSDIFKSSIEKLSGIQWRGNVSVTQTRKILGDLRQWYTKENPLLEGIYLDGMADTLDALANGEGVFTKEELKSISQILDFFTHVVENYNKVWRQGKWVEAEPMAKHYVDILQENQKRPKGLAERLLRTKVVQGYNEMFGDPSAVARMMDSYEDGFFTEMLAELRAGAEGAQVAEMEIRTDYEAFLKKNKGYLDRVSAEEVEYRGHKIPRMTLIGLYMTLKRDQAKAGFAASGFAFDNIKGERVRVDALVRMDEDVTAEDLTRAADDERGVIDGKLTKEDKAYIAILEKVYNEDAKHLKAERDMQRLGFTNATEGYYYPIRRGNIAKSVDTSEIAAELDRVSHASFNKNIVKGAKQELFIESADHVFNRHLRAVCQYAYLSPVIETYDKIYNLDTSGNPNSPVSIATESANVWKNGNAYFKKLISDIQGIPTSSGEGMRTLGRIRSAYAKYQLGANPKVWFSQLSSFFAAYSQLDADSITKGAFVSGKDVDTYCPLAKLRNYDNTAAAAQGVLDTRAKRAARKVDKIGDAMMVPIGHVDRFVVTRLFGACQVQVEKDGGAKVGTKANKEAAGKLLEKVIFETQQNSIATERSGAMRSGNEILRTLTMFSADGMKVIGRVIDGLGEVSYLKAQMKGKTGEARAALQVRLTGAQKRARKAIAALLTQAMFMTGIAQLFRWLYAKERDEDEPLEQTLALETVGNMLGGLPGVRDVYSRIVDGYDMDNYAYSAVNDLLNSTVGVFEAVGTIFSDDADAQSLPAAFRKLTYAVGQVTGIPVRNLYNVFYGLTKRASPNTAYKIDNVFYAKNYRTDLYKAIENGDDDRAAFLMSLVMEERVEGGAPESVRAELLSLLGSDYSVLPRAVPEEFTYNGETVELTEEQQAAISAYYADIPETLATLFERADYRALTAEQRADAISRVYDTYRALALSYVTGVDMMSGKQKIAAVVGLDTLAMLQIATKDITSDVDRKGNVIAGSKRKKVVAAINELNVPDEQKLLLICAQGYSLQDGDVRRLSATAAKKRLLRYILSLKVSKAEKEEIAKMCGFEVRNGRIVTKTAFSAN